MAGSAIRVRGLKELQRDFGKLSKTLQKQVRDELKKVAGPVAEDAQGKLGRYRGASVSTIRPRAAMRGVYVTQSARKKTGLRGDFGALQMREVLIPALEENTDMIVRDLEQALDRIASL